jgi:hypothetical protein
MMAVLRGYVDGWRNAAKKGTELGGVKGSHPE